MFPLDEWNLPPAEADLRSHLPTLPATRRCHVFVVTLEGSMGAVEECKRQIQDRLASRGVQIQVGPMNGGGGMGGMGGPGSYGGYQQPPQGYAQPQYGYPG
eukprot:Rmarinus@m.29985